VTWSVHAAKMLGAKILNRAKHAKMVQKKVWEYFKKNIVGLITLQGKAVSPNGCRQVL
jgi:hypothetical protein